MFILTYLDMIVYSIKYLKVRGGPSRQAIKVFIQTYFKKSSTRFDSALRNAFKKGVENNIIIQNKQRFRLSQEGKNRFKIIDSLIQK